MYESPSGVEYILECLCAAAPKTVTVQQLLTETLNSHIVNHHSCVRTERDQKVGGEEGHLFVLLNFGH